MRSFTATLLVLPLMALGACAGGPPVDRPSALRLVPSQAVPWREDFGDPTLKTLIEQADLGNLDVKMALTRLERADAEVSLARAARRPRLEVGAASIVGGETLGRARGAASPTLNAAYDVDLWGGLRQGRAAAASEFLATTDDAVQARRLVAAQTVQAYIALRCAQVVEASTARQSTIAAQRLDLFRARAREGVASVEAIAAAEEIAAEAVAAEQDAQAEVRVQTVRLQALLGVVGDLRLAAGDLPAMPSGTGPAVSSDAVDLRPDVRAAFARLQAADARRAQAIAASRPQFQIVAALGAPDAAMSALLDTRALAWAIAGSLGQTVFDGGAARARIAQATADADLAELGWRKAVIDGWVDLQTTVTRAAATATATSLAQQHLDSARVLMVAADRRHEEGVADGVATADARLAVEQAEVAQAQAVAKGLLARVERRLAVGEAA